MRSLAVVLALQASACGVFSPLPTAPQAPASRVGVALDATVALTREGTGRTYCSGVFVGEYVLTAAHCVDDGAGAAVPTLEFRTREGQFDTSAPISAFVIHFDDDRDVAVLVPAEVLRRHAQVPLAPDDPQPGDPVIAIGNPLGLTWTITTGVATGVRVWAGNGKTYLQVSSPASPGNSGGPVFNEYGEVVGIVVLQMGDPHLIFAVPLDALEDALEN